MGVLKGRNKLQATGRKPQAKAEAACHARRSGTGLSATIFLPYVAYAQRAKRISATIPGRCQHKTYLLTLRFCHRKILRKATYFG
jgi:hypothetical protein